MRQLALMVFLLALLSVSCSAGKMTQSESSVRDSRISNGWQLIKRWDFYNQLDGWKANQVVQPKSGGYVRVSGGVFDFGYSINGGIVFVPLEIQVIPNASYMLISRMRTSNPNQNLLGFLTPPDSDLKIYQRIKNTNWDIVKLIYSVSPISNLDIPSKIYPAIQLQTRQDSVSVDWVELWVYLPKSWNSSINGG